jgi:[ribosomal protein S5]-alanine N-acetyltransferase
MEAMPIETARLQLIPNSPADVRAQIEKMDAHTRKELSQDWLARVVAATAMDPWVLGFTLVHRSTGDVIGTCGFKAPPDADGMVEIAYGVTTEHQNRGYATEAAAALVTFAFGSGQVRVVRAHTIASGNASTRVLARCGFRSTGQVIDPEDGPVWRWETNEQGRA